MGIPKLKTKIAVADYLEEEKTRQIKHEFVDGEVFEMAGGSDVHNLIAGELYSMLVGHLRGSRCLPFFGDLKVRASRTIYYYPDVVVSWEEKPEDPYFRNRPMLIVEVTSPSTERIDRSEKLLFYLQIPSLVEYIIIAQHTMNVEVHRRQEDGSWLTYYFNESDDVVELKSVELRIPLPDLYARVEFPTNADTDI